jgi:predicted RNase H-like nuclease
MQSIQPKDASDVDILDALAAVCSPHRIQAGNAVCVSTKQEHDEFGLCEICEYRIKAYIGER